MLGAEFVLRDIGALSIVTVRLVMGERVCVQWHPSRVPKGGSMEVEPKSPVSDTVR